MTNEQFEVLLKAKNIMVEQVFQALNYLKSTPADQAVIRLYDLYLATYNNNNTKACNVIIRAFKKYQLLVKTNEAKSLILLATATSHVDNEQYNEAISLYYEYKKLDFEDSKLAYLFDALMLRILYENRIYSQFKKQVKLLIDNPYIYQVDGYYAALIYYKWAIINVYTNDKQGLNENLNELEKILNYSKTEYKDKCESLYSIIKILVQMFLAKSKQEKQQVIQEYKNFIDVHVYDFIIYETIEAQLLIIRILIQHQETTYAINRLNILLTSHCNYRLRLRIYQLLSLCYKDSKDEQYYETLEVINKLLLKNIQFNRSIVNEGLLNTIKFYENQKSYTEIKRQYEIDGLTGCFTRNVFYKKASEVFNLNHSGTLIYFDLNNLKETNDIYSHSVGDEYLRAFSQGIFNLTDSSYKLFRVGGDEFILITACIDKDKINKLICDIIDIFMQDIKVADHQIFIKFSAGVAFYPEHGLTIEEVVEKADKCMYEAKSNGGGFIIYEKK